MLRPDGVRNSHEPALLNCAATPSCGPWVPHDYAYNDKVKLQTKDQGEQLAEAEIYVCRKCKAPRRWGLV
jgi:hypothetical protein